MSGIAKVGEFLNTLTMQYELRYKWWINAVVMILSVPHCLCWSFYFQNIITLPFEKLSCAVEILIWSDAVDFLIKLLGMPYSVVTAQQACSTEMVKHWKAPLPFIPSSTSVNSSKGYKITIAVACTCITVAPIFAHHPISMWKSVNNHISCTTYIVCPVQHITKTIATTVVQHSNLCHTKCR